MKTEARETRLTWLALVASAGTLLCCAVPIALVALGLGATVAAITSSLPILVVLTQHKVWVFAGSAMLLALTGWLLFRPGRECPADAELAAMCDRILRWNRRIFWTAVAVWGIGFLAAYVALPLRIWLEAQ